MNVPAFGRRCRDGGLVHCVFSLVAGAGLALVCVGMTGSSTLAQTPLFYPDDPIEADHDTVRDASAVQPIPPSQYYDFIENTFLTPGDDEPIPALNTNTVDEVPDSTWFTNRIGTDPLSSEDLARGPNEFDTLDVDGWPVVEGKGSGRTPGWRVAAPDGTIYQIEFDPREYPERTSGAEIIGSRFYHAFGFNVAESYLLAVDPDQVFVVPNATIEIEGRRRPLTQFDIDAVLENAAQRPDGRYRAVASRFINGLNLGPFRYHGTRTDDPNDIFPHEHRRELRANRVFAAWLNHVDSRGINSLDGSVATSGRRLQDGRSLTTTGPDPPSCPATIRSNGVSSNQDSSSCVFGGTCGMP